MAKLTIIGRLGQIKEREGKDAKKYIAFSIAEPSYKNNQGEYVTPWYSFLVGAESVTGKFLLQHGGKLDVVKVEANQRQDNKDSSKVYNNNVTVERITSKKSKEAKTETENTTATEVPSVNEPVVDIVDDQGFDEYFN